MNIKDLEQLGLSEKEAKVYLATLELGHDSAQRIAEKAGLAKSTTYDVLKSLTKNGLVSVYVKGSRKRFTVIEPSILREKIQKQEKTLEKLLPELRALYSTTLSKPKVRIYEGKSGWGIVTKEILAEADEVIAISSAEDVFEKLSDYYPEFPKIRAQHKIPLRLITRDSPKARERQRLGPQELRQVKIINTKFPFHSLIQVWKNKTAVSTLSEDIIILLIESRDLAQTFKAIFELLWEKSEQ